jgi:hypothetical protein
VCWKIHDSPGAKMPGVTHWRQSRIARLVRRLMTRAGERNAYLRSFPPGHAAAADGCVVKHKIECIGNSNVTFRIKAGAPVRQVADRTINRRPAALEGDARSIASAAGAARLNSALFGLSISIFRPRASARFPSGCKTRSLSG